MRKKPLPLCGGGWGKADAASLPGDPERRRLPAVVGAFAGFGERHADFEAEVVEVERLALGDRFTAGLTLGFFRAAGDV